MDTREYALIVAGGIGTRMNSDLPKQFLKVNGKPLLMHTLSVFRAYSQQITIILVLPPEHLEFWNNLCIDHQFRDEHRIVSGGKSRFQSVLNGLNSLEGTGYVAIHDGVRPLVSSEVIKKSFITAREYGTAVASVKLKDSLRKVDLKGNRSVNRNDYRLIQTPQTFKIELVKKAYAEAKDTEYTDDASVLEDAGYSITLIEGNSENVKVTTVDDLKIVEALMGSTV